MADEEEHLPMAGQEGNQGEVLTQAGKVDTPSKQIGGMPGKEATHVNGLSHTAEDSESISSPMEVDSDAGSKENTNANVANGVAPSIETTQENGVSSDKSVQEDGRLSPDDPGNKDATNSVDESEKTDSALPSNGQSASSGGSTQEGKSVKASSDGSSGPVGGRLADDDVQILSNPSKPDDDVIVIDDDDDDDDDGKKETPRPAKSTRKKSSQALLCKCILCGEMVRLSNLGAHVNSSHSKLIGKGNADIECKVCLQSFNWNNFVDHAQVKHKWSIVKNAASKGTSDSQLRKDYYNMGIFCMWCRENTDVSAVAAHFKAVHKVDETVIERALHLNHKKGEDKTSAPIPTGIMGALFVTCQECNKDLKFADVISHFQIAHKNSKRLPNRSNRPRKTVPPSVQPIPNRVTVPSTTARPPVQTSGSVPPVKLNQNEQLITLFKGQLNRSKTTNYALVKLAHDGKDKILSIPLVHPIAKHRVHTVAVKGKLDDIPALIKSVTDMLAGQQPPPPDPVDTTVPDRATPVKAPSTKAVESNTTAGTAKDSGGVQVSEPSDGDSTELASKSTDNDRGKPSDSKEERTEADKTSISKPSSQEEEDNNSGGNSSTEKKEESEGESASSSKSSPKKSSPRGSYNRLLELQKESLTSAAPKETEPEPTGTPLRRSSRRAKMAAKLKIKSVVEKEVQDWKKQLDQPEYVPEDEEVQVKKLPQQQNVTYVAAGSIGSKVSVPQHATKTIEQYVFRVVQDGRRVLTRVPPSQTTINVSPGRVYTTPVVNSQNQQMTRGAGQTLMTSPMLQRPVGTLSPIAPRKKTPTILQQQRSPVTIQTSPVRGTVLTASPMTTQTSTTLLSGGITLQTQQVYQQSTVQSPGQVVLGSNPGGYIIHQQQPQQRPGLTLVQPTTILQQPFGVQLQPQTVPIQNPNMMMMQQQNQLQLVTTPQGQQILVMPNNNIVQNQQVVVSQMQQNRVVLGAQTKTLVSQPAVKPTVQSTTKSTMQISATTANSQQPLKRVTRSTAAQQPTKAAPVKPLPTKAEDLDPLIIKRGNDSLLRISDLQKVDDGYVCHQSDISVAAAKDKVMREVQLVKKKETPVPVTMPDKIGFQPKKASDDFLSKYDEFDRMVKLNILTKDITPSELPDIPSVMFECARCGVGMPTFMLLRIHLAECFAHPPAEEQAYIIRMPFPLLQMYYDTGVEPGGVVSCKLCSKIIPRSDNKDLGPLQAHVREHQAQKTAQKGGSVTFGVLSLNKVCILKCKICGETIMRLWQDIVPMSAHLQKHIKGNAEILCNQPPVVGLTNKAHAQHISKKAYTWVDYIVPPFTMENPPISEKQRNLDHHVATQGILHYESLLPRRKRRHMMLPETPKLRGKANQPYQSNMRPLIIETFTADTMTSYDIKPGKTTNLLNSIKLMPSPDKIKRSTLTASIPIKAKHKTLMTQSTGSNRRKIFRQGQYRSARLQEKREKYMKEMDEAAAAETSSPLNPSTPVKMPDLVKDKIHPVTLHSAEKSPGKAIESQTKEVLAAAHVSRPIADIRSSSRKEEKPKKEPAKPVVPPRVDKAAVVSPKKETPAVKRVHVPNPEMKIPDDSSDEDVQEVPSTESAWGEEGIEYVEPVMPPRTPSPEKPETPPPPITETDIEDYLHILEGCDSTADDKLNVLRPLPEIGDVALSDYFGDSANTSILCEPLIIEQAQAPMYFTRSINTGYRFKCSFSKCEAAVPNNTLVMLAHLSQHFRVRIAGDFSQNGSVTGHRRTCKSLPLTINQVAAHFTLSDREEASLHGGEVQMAYVCQWRNCSRTRTFKKGLITHLYRHVTFHLISESEHAVLKEKSKPLKLSSAQFVPHGSGTKLITETMNTGHGSKFINDRNPSLTGAQSKESSAGGAKVPIGNYGDGSPLGTLIARLTKQITSDVQPDGNGAEVSKEAGTGEDVPASKDTGGMKTEGMATGGKMVRAEEKVVIGGHSKAQPETSGSSDSDGKRKHNGDEEDPAAVGPAMKKTKVSEEEDKQGVPAAPDKNTDTSEAEMTPPAKRLKRSDGEISQIGGGGDSTKEGETGAGEGDQVDPGKADMYTKSPGDATDEQLPHGEEVMDTKDLKKDEVEQERQGGDSEEIAGRLDVTKERQEGGKVDLKRTDVTNEQLQEGGVGVDSEDLESDGSGQSDSKGSGKRSDVTQEVSVKEREGKDGSVLEGAGNFESATVGQEDISDSNTPPPPLLSERLSDPSLSKVTSEDDKPMPDLQSVDADLVDAEVKKLGES